MPFTTMSPTTVTSDGVTLAAAAAVDGTNGNQFTNDGRTMIEVTNGSGSSIVATFVTYGSYTVGSKAYAIADSPVSVAAGATKGVGPFDKTLYNNPATGMVEVTWSLGTSVTARVIALGTF